MGPVRRLVLRFITLLRAGRAEADLSREIDAHLQLLEDRFAEQGMSARDARAAARRAFGGVEQTKERQRDVRSFRWLTGWPMDLKLGVRMLAKTPGLTAIAVVALAVAIGAGAAYHEFMRDLIHPTLRVPGASRIVGIRVWDTERRAMQVRLMHDFAVWRSSASTLDLVGASIEVERHLITADGRTDPAQGEQISASAFRLYPALPLLGRTLLEEDERPAAEPVVVIGHDLWRTRFDADPTVIGRTVRLGPTVHTIVGVMPEGYGFPVNASFWTPLKVQDAGLERGQGPPLWTFGRLKDGQSADAARAELQGLLGADARPALRVDVQPYLDSLLSSDRGSLEALVLFAANFVFVMLLGVCGANVATLVFARTAMREAEITVRTALGASRRRISAQLFAEALVLSGVAGLAGLAVARFVGLWAKQTWMEAAGAPRPFWWDDGFSPSTLLYVASLVVLAALIVGVIPALKATGRELQGRLREAGAAGSSLKFGGIWTAVVVAQTAITVIFLATVTALAWTAIRGQYGHGVTYPREQFLTAQLEPDVSRAGPGGTRPIGPETLQSIVNRLQNEPGVAGVTYATALPGTTWEQFRLEFAAPDVAAGARFITDEPWSEGSRVGMNFFETLGIRLVSGRLFTDAEIVGAHHVAVVDETWARTILGGRNALGVMVREPAGGPARQPGPWHEIVGVVTDVTTRAKPKGPDDAVLYRPAGAGDPVRLLVRTQGPAAQLSHSVQLAALSAAPDVRLDDVMSVDRLAESEAMPVRFFLRVSAVIGAVALLLSTAGIYALISFTLARRTREIGIRVALGAAPRRIITNVFSRAFVQIGLGVAAGALPSLVIFREGFDDSAALGFVAGVSATLGVCAFVLLVAAIGCVVPLRRALSIEPTQALRMEA